MTLRIALLGQLQVTAGTGLPLTGWRPRAQRLLAYLLLHRHRPLPRATLAYTLWPEQPDDEALATLRRALSDLRAGLPPDAGDWLLTAGGVVRWQPEQPYWLDIDEFEHLVGQATPAALHQAVALYAGDLLAGWDEEWLWAERDRLRGLQLAALGQLVAHHRAAGGGAPALALARQALTLDPLAEAMHRELMALHYAGGDRAAALAAYERLRSLLRDEFGAEPMAATRALHAAIVRGEPPTAATVAAPAPPTGPAQPRLIGREADLAALTALWQRAAAGQGRVVIIGGEAGVGKSRLALGLAEEAAGRGGLVLVGHCDEFEQALPYQPILEALRAAAPLLRHADLLPAHRAALARLAPEVLGLAGAPPAADVPPADLRARLFEAVLHTFLMLGRLQPLLLVIEDAHWAAESTLDWLTYSAPRLGETRVLLVITHRTHELGAAHALVRLGERLGRDDRVTTLRLAPLSATAHRALVGQLSGLDEAARAPVADRLFAETAGNPFFLHEIVRGLLEAGQLVVRGGRWGGPLVEAAATTAVPVPESVRTAIDARLARLPVQARRFLQAAAVAGRAFHYEVVQQAGGWAAEPALAAVEAVLARGFVREEASGDTFSFAHHLVREAIIAGLPGPRRRDWHRRLATTLEALRPDDLEALAHHHAQAGDAARAAGYALRAGDRARGLAAPHEAAAHYRAALAGWPAGDAPGRASLLRKLGEALWLTGALPEAGEALEAARALWETLGDREGAGATERLIGRIWWERGQRQESARHYQRALAILEGGPESAELARAVSAIAQMHMLAFAFDEAIAWGERALALAARLKVPDVTVHALNNVGVARTATGEPERGLAMLRDSLERALALGLLHDAARAYYNLAELLIGEGHFAEAHATYAAMLAFVRRTHVLKDGGWPLIWLAHLEWQAGRWADALTRRREYLAWAGGNPAPRLTHVRASTVFGRIDNELGQPAAACRLLEEELPAARSADELQTTAPYLGQLARAYALLGRAAEARQLIEQMLAWVDGSPHPYRDCTLPVLWACRWLADGAGGAALDEARACLGRLERAAAHFRGRETAGALAEGHGRVLLAEGAAARAVEQLQAAVAQWSALERPYDQARVLADLGRALAAAGDAAGARAAVEQALGLCDGLAAQLAEADLRRSFLASPLIRALRAARAGAPARA